MLHGLPDGFGRDLEFFSFYGLPPAGLALFFLRFNSSDQLHHTGEKLGLVAALLCGLQADGSVETEVRIVSLPASHPLAQTRDEENRFLVTDAEGKVHDVFGKGAGRWPTAMAVFADVMDAQRVVLGRLAEAGDQALKLRA